MTDNNLNDLNEKIAAFRRQEKAGNTPSTGLNPEQQARMDKGMHIGMRAGSIFISSVLAGGVLGFGLDHFLHTTPLFLLLLFFAGFGLGLYRCQAIMNEKA